MNKSTLAPHSPKAVMRGERITLDQARADEFLALVERAYKEKPDKKDLQQIKDFLIEFPELCKAVYSFADNTRESLLQNMFGQNVTTMAMEEYTIRLRNEFGYYESPIVEQRMIENIILNWLRMYWYESQLNLQMGREVRMSVVEWWERRLSMAQRRYLSACESLARIRKMKVPALQLNIGDKQINIAGDVTPGSNK